MKQTTINEFLTEREIAHCARLFNISRDKPHTLAKSICEEVIKPSLNRINRTLGQQNDPMYLAYAVEYALTMASKQR